MASPKQKEDRAIKIILFIVCNILLRPVVIYFLANNLKKLWILSLKIFSSQRGEFPPPLSPFSNYFARSEKTTFKPRLETKCNKDSDTTANFILSRLQTFHYFLLEKPSFFFATQ
jgi:hypothetical protein